jgi:host cell factor
MWAPLRTTGVAPPPRKMHAAVYVNSRMFLFGGEREAGVLDDLFSLKLPPGMS